MPSDKVLVTAAYSSKILKSLKNFPEFLSHYNKWATNVLTELSFVFKEKNVIAFLKNTKYAKELIVQFDEYIQISVSLMIDANSIMLKTCPVFNIPTYSEIDMNKVRDIHEKFKDERPSCVWINKEVFPLIVIRNAFIYLYLISKLGQISYDESKKSFNNLKDLSTLFDISLNNGELEKLENLLDEKNKENYLKIANNTNREKFLNGLLEIKDFVIYI